MTIYAPRAITGRAARPFLPIRFAGDPVMSASTLIVLAVIVVIVLWAITVYNGLISMRQRVNQAFADIDVQLKQRHDLVPNLVETVKGYAAHERGTLDDVVKARNAAVSAQGPAQQAAAENMLSGALRQLFALSESYPDLKASANFQQLQGELSDLENKIAGSRRFFNNAVQEYNSGIQRFPAALFAGALTAESLSVYADVNTLLQLALADTIKALPFATVGTIVWIFIAYYFH